MKIVHNVYILSCLFLISFVFNLSAFAKDVYVKGYYKKNGTYVEPYHRTSPDSIKSNNYSYPGNYNPWTGKVAPGGNTQSDNDDEYSSTNDTTKKSSPIYTPGTVYPSDNDNVYATKNSQQTPSGLNNPPIWLSLGAVAGSNSLWGGELGLEIYPLQMSLGYNVVKTQNIPATAFNVITDQSSETTIKAGYLLNQLIFLKAGLGVFSEPIYDPFTNMVNTRTSYAGIYGIGIKLDSIELEVCSDSLVGVTYGIKMLF